MPTLTVTTPTWAKSSCIQSELLGPSDKFKLEANDYPLLAYTEAITHELYQKQSASGVHMVVTFDPAKIDLKKLHPSGRNTWVVYCGHAEVEGNIPGNNPREPLSPVGRSGRIIALAGLGDRGMGDLIDGCQHFRWGEALREGDRLPDNAHQSKNIVQLARYLDQIRAKLGGRPITITSWLRPESVNRAVGGARNSTHLQGFAADFAVAGMSPRQVFSALDGWHGSRGGLAHGSGFTHVDLRNYRARWTYPGAR